MKKFILLSFCVWLSSGWAAGPPASLQLSQARLALPTLTAYLAVSDAEGKRINALRAEQFSANLGELKLPVKQIQPFEKTGEGVAYIILVDISKSLKPEQFVRIHSALSEWVDTLTEHDRMALLSFGESVKTVVDFSADKSLLKQKIQELNPTDMQTALHKALIQAMHVGQRADADLPNRRVIVVLSDGIDDLSGGPTPTEVLHLMDSDRIPIYAMGLDNAKPDNKQKKEQKEGIKALGLFARSSGGDYMGVGSLPLEKVYANARARIKAVTVMYLDCKTCPADGNIHRLQITLQDHGLALNDGVDIRLLPSLPPPSPSSPPPQPIWKSAWFYLRIAAAVISLLVAGGSFWVWRRKRPRELPSATTGEVSAQSATETSSIVVIGHIQPTPSVPKCKIHLVEIGRKGRGKTYKLEVAGETVIGRAKNCAVSIPNDTEISIRHCALSYKNQGVFLHDLSSTNGTQVNGVPISSAYRLQEGDIIGIGRTELRVLILGNKS